ncbi:MAG: efflux RND transporter periplasmic adaptor subunit [Oceanobacter sp.]
MSSLNGSPATDSKAKSLFRSGWFWGLAAIVFLILVVLYTQSQMSSHANRAAPGMAGGPGAPGGPAGGSPGPGGGPSGSGGAPQASQSAQTSAPPQPDQQQESDVAAEVSVVEVSTGEYQARFSGYGEADARYELTLTSQVSGRVESLSSQFETGHRVKKGVTLADVESIDYRAAVASAKQAVADAQVALLEEEREGQQAQLDWNNSGLSHEGGEPDSPLLLRQPQLEAAQAALNNAKAELAVAQRDLARTRIQAPFNGLITERFVSPGSYIQAGADVATLLSTDRVEIRIALSPKEWDMMPDNQTLADSNWPARVEAVNSNGVWPGVVERVEQHLNTSTRQRSLVVAVEQPLDQNPVLNPGSFVSVSLSGVPVTGLWQLPGSALSQRGEIWYVDQGSGQAMLQRFASEVVFADSNNIYVRPPAALANQSVEVLVHPLSSYTSGMKVKPVLAESNSGEAE